MTKLGNWLAAAVLAFGVAAADNPESVLTTEIGRQNNQSLLWGPYKPNLYFGVRPRVTKGLWTGLMWGGVNTFEEVPKNKYPPGRCAYKS